MHSLRVNSADSQGDKISCMSQIVQNAPGPSAMEWRRRPSRDTLGEAWREGFCTTTAVNAQRRGRIRNNRNTVTRNNAFVERLNSPAKIMAAGFDREASRNMRLSTQTLAVNMSHLIRSASDARRIIPIVHVKPPRNAGENARGGGLNDVRARHGTSAVLVAV